VRLLNLPPQLRNKMQYILLAGIHNTRFAKANGGVCRMLAGVGPNGEKYAEVCLRTDLERLAAGVPIELPDDVNGGSQPWVLEFHFLGWLADLLGAHGLGPWPESFQARHCCRDCWWCSKCWCANLPPDCRERAAKREHCEGCEGEAERELPELLADLETLRGDFRTKKSRVDFMRDRGISKTCARPTHLPPHTLACMHPSSDA
jgi:hypothetical protein